MIKKTDIEVSEACKLSLLDFLSINNSQDYSGKNIVYEEWFKNEQNLNPYRQQNRLNFQNTWKLEIIIETFSYIFSI